MRVGVFIGDATGRRTSVEELLAGASDAEARGLSTAWVPHIPWSLDALTALALASTVTSSIELGTAVVPTFPRHPLSLAQDALSVQAASGGRLALGIGPSHPVVIEKMYGLSYAAPAAHTEEYVEVLQACFRSNQIDHEGERFAVHSMLEVPGATPPTLLVAALAPRMLELTGRLADGTITYWADERAIGDHVAPRITAAAAGRAAPRVVAGIPVAVVRDVDAARARAARVFGAYEHIPTYQRILDRGDAGAPVDAAIIGDEATVRRRIQAFADAGATDLCAAVAELDEGSRERTLDLLASLA